MEFTRYLFSLSLLTTVFVLDVDAQRPVFRQHQPKDAKVDLNRIVGVCGCDTCNRRLEHNEPSDEDDEGNNFVLGNRWTTTVLSGGGLSQGDPTILTWSIIPDGTDANGGAGFVPSNMIAVWDTLFNEPNAGTPDLTNRFWHGLIQQALDRWAELSGVEYVYEPNDDGVPNFNFGGVLGVRGDVRIGGYNIDGPGNVLAFNQFPNVGDMAVDTSDTGTYGNPFGNFRLFRNIYCHEQGHGLGIAHLESNNANFLMEPFISAAFDGPQLDDVRAIHRHYGDVFEKSNNFQGNNTIANATDLGVVNDGSTLTIGVDGAAGTVVLPSRTDFVSIDDNDDIDFYRFTINGSGFVNIVLTPVGATYNQSAQGGGGGTPINTSNSSNLALALFNSAGGIITNVNTGGLGQPEMITDLFLDAGNYFVRATGSNNAIQLYTLSINFEQVATPTSTPPTSLIVTTGSVVSGGVAQLASSDNQYLELEPVVPAVAGGDSIAVLLNFTSPDVFVSQFSLTVDNAANTDNVQQRISLFNHTNGMFEQIDIRELTFNDASYTVVPSGNIQRFVQVPSGNVLGEVRYKPVGPVFLFPWAVRIDQFVINTLN